MDQLKIGGFIAECRKKQSLTQSQLAEKLNVTDKAISKWETGRGLPDVASMLPLCEILGISVNDLLSGEVIRMENYNKEMENNLLEMVKAKEEADKILAEYLAASPYVDWVFYPGLSDNPDYELGKKYMPLGAGGVLTFGIKGGLAAGNEFVKQLKLVSLAVHVGDIRSCVLHPSSTTHRQLSEAEQIAAGIKPELIRVSVGCENIEDIVADFEQALKAAAK